MGENVGHKEIQTREKTDITSESFQSTHSFPAQKLLHHALKLASICANPRPTI